MLLHTSICTIALYLKDVPVNLRAKKQTDIILLGDSALISAILQILKHAGVSLAHIAESEKVHFVDKGVIVHEGERMAAKKFLISTPTRNTAPKIKGLDSTKYTMIQPETTLQKSKNVVVIGYGEKALETVIHYALSGSSVDLVSPIGTILPDYDSAVQDKMLSRLKKLKVRVGFGCLPIASLTKGGMTYILTTQTGKARKYACDDLFIEPYETLFSDIGLDNHTVSYEPEHANKLARNTLFIDEGRLSGSLYDAELLANRILGKRTKSIDTAFHTAHCNGLDYFSAGILEQDFTASHIGYKRSVVKILSPNTDSVGFVKVIANLRGNIVGASGVIPFEYPNKNIFHYAVQDQMKTDQLAKLLPSDDPLVSTFLELFRELN